MTSPSSLRLLRLGGAALILAYMALLASSWFEASADSRAATRAEAGGVITGFADDAVVISGEGGERYTVIVTPSTIVRDGASLASLVALRPGRFAAVLEASERAGLTMTARTILVWGGRS